MANACDGRHRGVRHSVRGAGRVLTGCRIKKFEDSPKAGNEAAEVKFGLHLMYVKRNDLAPVNHLLEG